MYTIEHILELIKQNPNEEYVELKQVVEIPFGEVVYCHGFDELIDILDDMFCDNWIPKGDCDYELIGCSRGLYHTHLQFLVTISVDVADFLSEYDEEDEYGEE